MANRLETSNFVWKFETLSCRGDVLEVKVLGILAMVDDGETDWKVIGWFPQLERYYLQVCCYVTAFTVCPEFK